MPEITVIIPAKIRVPQEAEWLKVALKSVPAGIPIVLVNDHSLVPWADVEAVCKFKKSIKVKHLLEERKGLAAARNFAMEDVKTKYFFPLDADDYLAPGALQTALDAYPGDGFLYGSTILFDDEQRTTYQAQEYDYAKLMEAVYWPNGCLQLTENWKAVGGWDETLPLYEDWDYWLRSGKLGICGHHIADTLYCYRRNPNGIINTLMKNQKMVAQARQLIQAKHADIYRGEFTAMCCGRRSTPALTKAVPIAPKSNEPLPAVDGMTIMVYIGGALAALSFYGDSGTRYRFGGQQVRGYVANQDVAGLLARRERGHAIFKKEE